MFQVKYIRYRIQEREKWRAFCIHGCEPTGSIKHEERLDQLRICHFLKKDSAPCNHRMVHRDWVPTVPWLRRWITSSCHRHRLWWTIWQRPSRCVVTNLYNVLYSVNTQPCISTVILYIHSGHIIATCFDRKRPSSGQYRTFLRYNKVSTQWDPISFTVRVKITCDEILIYNLNGSITMCL